MSLAAMIAKQKAEAEAKAATAGSPVVESAPEAPKPAAKLSFGVKKATASTPTPTPTPTPTAIADSPVVSNEILNLDDIADTTVEGLDNSERGQFAFDDEIPATAPIRELPPELESQQQEFVASLNSIYEVVHDPELFGQMIRTIMQELQENPDYVKLMADQDVHTMIRGLRQSMGLAKVKKAEKVTKTRAGSKKAPAAAAMLGTADAIFNSEDW